MGEINPIKEAFVEVEQITVINNPDFMNSDALLRVESEDAVGDFFGVARRNNIELEGVSRNHLEDTVMDSWANYQE
jgi:hypothetical protein